MKKLLYTSIIAFSIFIAPSCNKNLDVQPKNSATPDQFKTSADVETLLFGAYEQLQNYGGFGEQYLLVPDLIASDEQVDWVGTYSEYKDIQHQSVVATNYVMGTLWGNSYKAVNAVNTVLDKLSIIDSADKATVEGECKFIRATVFFELLGIFAKPYSDGQASTNLGIPLVLQPTYVYDSTKNKPSRATVAATYAQIISDLQDAIAKLPETNLNYRADLYSAKAILSRVYLNMQDYTNAAIQADDVIASGKFKLTAIYNLAFNNNNNSSEDIFAIQQTAQSNAGTSNQGIETFYAPYGGQPAGQPSGRGDAQINTDYYNYFEDGDFRKTYITSGYSISGITGDYPNKWSLFYKAIPVVRLAEMYLTRGEANLMAGTSVGAAPLDDINIVRARSEASLLTTVAGQDFVDERFRELGFEGDRMWTLKRLKMDVDGLGYDDDLLIMPIPQAEIDVNANIKQNTGY